MEERASKPHPLAELVEAAEDYREAYEYTQTAEGRGREARLALEDAIRELLEKAKAVPMPAREGGR